MRLVSFLSYLLYMNRLSILLVGLFTVFSFQASAQLELETPVLDFKVIDRGSPRLIETYIINRGDEAVTLLRVEADPIYDIRSDKRRIEPGDRVNLRIKLNPLTQGVRQDLLKIEFNTKPVLLDLMADVRYVDPADNTPCPDFEHKSTIQQSDWKAFFKVVDRKTGERLGGAELELLGRMGLKAKHKADKNGEILITLPIDYYSISVKKSGYASFSLESYINRRNKNFELELMSGEGGSVVEMRPGQKEKPVEEEPLEVLKIKVESEEETKPVELAEEAKVEEVPVEEPEEFSIREFKANNVVFLIDVSTSMRQSERMELLKSNMISLTQMLRPEDLISIVTYASTTEVIVSGKSAGDIDGLSAIINELEAEGMSAGEAGLKQAYKLCSRYFIDQGNNQVYLATDGAFNKGSGKIIRMVSKKAEEDMKLSVLAIRSSDWTDRKMKELAKAGNGQHLSIQDKSEDGLKDLIKVQSKR